MNAKLARVQAILLHLRADRDSALDGSELRRAYNAACDRLDVLESKLIEARDAGE